MKYEPAVIEPKWQKYWEENGTFTVQSRIDGNQRKKYVLDMFPYPSANGLHVGHPEGYTATDIVCRFERMQGTAVLHPMGWDSFGLPAEQQAKKTGIPPRTITEKNIANFRRQLKMLGFSYDWTREVATTDTDYFKWTQWIFLLLYNTWFDPVQQKGRPISELPIPQDLAGTPATEAYRDEHRLAYQIEAPVNWCPALGTVLANEEVIQGRSERGNHPVVRMPLRQWMLRITAYADRLESDLEQLDWSDSVKALQRNWIGRSTGAEIDFYVGETAADDYEQWKTERQKTGFPRKPEDFAHFAAICRLPSAVLRIYTTRPDTLFGATYMVIAPEHPLVENLTTPERKEAVVEYCRSAASKSDLDRTELSKEKTGVFTGSYAVNPATGQPIPIWIADYVLISYGTGAIMAVPGHDTRDYEFAKQFGLPIVEVVQRAIGDGSDSRDGCGYGYGGGSGEGSGEGSGFGGGIEVAFTGEGWAINSDKYNGLSTVEFKEKITADLSQMGVGRKAVNYKLRDWLFSRQHFWGEPFPLLHEVDENNNMTGRCIALEESELPLDMPADLKFDAAHNSPEPPLEHAPDSWLYVERNGKKYKRETNTMPQWAGSCWYYLRFIDPKNGGQLVSPELEKQWMPVDLYVGGAEHAVLHLLYARFWHKVLFDYGIVSTPEPFQKLVNQGMILGETEFTGFILPKEKIVESSFTDYESALKKVAEGDAAWVSVSEISIDRDGYGTLKKDGTKLFSVKLSVNNVGKNGDNFFLKDDGVQDIQVDSRANKMSKSRGNVVNPDDVVVQYGADALRLYEMFMGPLESVKPWSMDGVRGVRNFLDRVWKMIVDVSEEAADGRRQMAAEVQNVPLSVEQNRMLHKTVKQVTLDIQTMSFNTAISRMMEFVNFFLKQEVRPKRAMEKFVLILSPLAPHICEELWQLLGHGGTLAYEPLPQYDESVLLESQVEIPISINGKLRSKITAAVNADEQTLEVAALSDARIAELTAGKTIVKKIIVPGKMINLVVK
ncbi:MAG: class I tRNA ligase family protein [Planctomycetaceae bacterium]|nr:class I tRNA ligase family protein [Planctomycetaceae bacterium]